MRKNGSVRICEQNPGSKGSEVSEAESNALQGFDTPYVVCVPDYMRQCEM